MRKLLGVLSWCFGLNSSLTALRYLLRAVRLLTSPEAAPYKGLYTQEYFLTFCFSTLLAAFFFWWGYRLFKRN